MLKLMRRQGERIIVIPPDSGPIRVTLIEIKGGKVYLGFRADQETEILREELYEAMVRDGDRQPVE